MKKFNIPEFYRSPIISQIKSARRLADSRKKDLSPSELKVGNITFRIARHFGFCYGVENAIEIAFRAIAENPGKNIYLLSEMIHNPSVNADLESRGVRFLMGTDGSEKIPLSTLTSKDVVIVPAFGTTVEMFEQLRTIGVDPQTYNATCPFVEKVWNRSQSLGSQGYTIIIHGKHYHEETRATFSHAKQSAPSVVIRNLEEAKELAKFIVNSDLTDEQTTNFFDRFGSRCSAGFNPSVHLMRVGVVNQTTMLAGETATISEYFRSIMIDRFGEENIKHHIADTKDTLCYATSENQEAINSLVATKADLAIVIGGYNSSNTTHLAKLCARHLPTYHIQDSSEIVSSSAIRHLDLETLKVITTDNWLPDQSKVDPTVLISAGASSPDALVDAVIERLCQIFGVAQQLKPAVQNFLISQNM
jgi:4-hydroxy-3-methylbut-2-enyl diphosphate reductase